MGILHQPFLRFHKMTLPPNNGRNNTPIDEKLFGLPCVLHLLLTRGIHHLCERKVQYTMFIASQSN